MKPRAQAVSCLSSPLAEAGVSSDWGRGGRGGRPAEQRVLGGPRWALGSWKIH